MSLLHAHYTDGQRDALSYYKLAAPRPTHPVVRDSALLSGKRPDPQLSSTALQQLQPPTSPETVKNVFNVQEQGKTRLEPPKKIAEALCTTCRKPRHYGTCAKPLKTRPAGEPFKQGGFNPGMYGDDPSQSSADATGPNYSSATSDSAPGRLRDGRPAGEQASSAFADFVRHFDNAFPNEAIIGRG